MEQEKIARCLILQYLESCCASDASHHDELEVAIECLKNIWNLEKHDVTVPGVKSIVDLIPAPKYDTEKALALKAEGNTALQNGNFDIAIAKYTEAIQVDPTQATFYCNRAAAYTKKEDFNKAIPDCEEAIRLDPSYATAYSRLGFAYYSLGKIEEAREAYNRGIRACPTNESLKSNLASLGPEPAQQQQSAGGAPDFASMIGQFASNPGMLSQLTEKLKSPEVLALMQEPGMAEFLQQIQSNPGAIFSLLSDPRMQRLMGAVMGGAH